MEEDNSIEEKQEFLRERVLEKGLDANKFADYLVTKRGEEAADINTWSMKDLKQAVKEFIQKEELKKKESQNEENHEDGEDFIIEGEDKIENEIKINTNEETESKIIEKESIGKKIEKNPKQEKKEEIKKENVVKKEITLPPEIYGIVGPHTFGCRKLENTPLSSVENPIITLSSPELIEGGFFSKSYITYLITTKEPSLSVRRRYSDFVWFHQTLLELYPYVVIPPIPKKNKIGIDNFSNVFIAKRKRYLEKFLKWLLANPVIKNSQLLYDFLSIEKDEDLNNKKLEYQKVDRPMNLLEFYAKDGKMNLDISKEKQTYFQNISDNNTNNEILLENLNYSIKQLKIIFDIFIQRVDDVQKKWEALFMNSTKYFEDIGISNTYDKMSKLFTKWSEFLKKQNKLVFVNLREYYKYIKNNFRDMKKNISNVEAVKNDYYFHEKSLIYKKEDLFKRGDVTKWELDPQEKANPKDLLHDKFSALFKMCAKDTDRCIQRKIYYGYYLNQLIEEHERIRNFNGKNHKDNLMKFCQNLAEIISDFHNHIVENLTSLVFEENKYKKESDN